MNPSVTKPAAPEPSEREKFETWADAEGYCIHRDDTDKYRDYHRATTRFAWDAWNARAALKPAVPEPDSAQSSVHQVEPTTFDAEDVSLLVDYLAAPSIKRPAAADEGDIHCAANKRSMSHPWGEPNDDGEAELPADWLLPCPCCDSHASFHEIPNVDGHPDAGAQFVMCDSALCMLSTSLMFPLMDSVRPLLAERWNRRATVLSASESVTGAAEADEQQSAAVPAPVEPTASPMRIWIDTEFNEHARRHELISLALVADDGKEWYEVLPCQWPGPWVAENVMPRLGKPPVSPAYFAETLREFLAQYEAVHVIGDWPTDIALFCDALIVSPGCRIDTPPLTFEVIRLDGESADPHNALADARGIRDVHRAALNPKRPVEGKS